METIECPTKAPCGHSFHFECLFRWGRQHNSCPLCRGKLLDVEEEESEFNWYGPRSGIIEYVANTLANSDRRFIIQAEPFQPRRLREEAERRYRERPLNQYTGEQPDPLDVQLIADQTGVSEERARTFLKYFEYDIVDTIMFLQTSHSDFAIPDYRQRIRPDAPTEYIQRDIQRRVVFDRPDGYESA